MLRTAAVTPFDATNLVCGNVGFMRDPRRIDAMTELVRAVWRKYPDWRLAQLVLNAHAASETAGEAYFTEDEVVEHGLRRLLGSSPDDRGIADAA